MATPGIVNVNIQRTENGKWVDMEDQLAIEEPLEISIAFGQSQNRQTKRISVTMRTPGNDAELALGFLFTEGIIHSLTDVQSWKHADTLPGIESNRFLVELNPELNFELSKLDRNFYTTSSCGVCGKASIDAIKTTNAFTKQTSPIKINKDIFYTLPEKLRLAQQNFESTGGIHASALFTKDGDLIALREDVGRYNALDRLIGYFLTENKIPLNQHILLLSGRASFELLQKASMAGIQMVCAIGAPSSLAVETAKEFGVTLVGFLKSNKMNVYCGETF